MSQALGYAVCEEMTFDENGCIHQQDLDRYHIFRADEMPQMEVIFIETFEPSHPFGVKAVAEIPSGWSRPSGWKCCSECLWCRYIQYPHHTGKNLGFNK